MKPVSRWVNVGPTNTCNGQGQQTRNWAHTDFEGWAEGSEM